MDLYINSFLKNEHFINKIKLIVHIIKIHQMLTTNKHLTLKLDLLLCLTSHYDTIISMCINKYPSNPKKKRLLY